MPKQTHKIKFVRFDPIKDAYLWYATLSFYKGRPALRDELLEISSIDGTYNIFSVQLTKIKGLP